jgi:hypothetical protein
MISTKWFNVIVGYKPREFKRFLLENSYDRARPSGVDLAYARENYIAGRFIEEVRSTITYTSPLGEEITNNLVNHKIFSFAFYSLGETRWLLRVDGNPRSLRTFSRFLSNILDFNFAISLLVTPPLDVLRHLEQRGVKIIKTTHLYALSLPLTTAAMGKIEVKATSDGDALVAFREAFERLEHAIERLTAQVEFQFSSGAVSISKSGALVFDDETVPEIVDLFMEYLTESLRIK